MNSPGRYDDYAAIAELYDFVPAYAGRRDMGFYLGFCHSAGGKVLELGCGTGRILIRAAALGCSLTGLDLSQHMLAICRRKLTEQSQEVQDRVRLVQGDMADFDLKETFSLIIIPFRPFQHLLTVDDQMACLGCIRRHLADDGKLVFDFFQVDPQKLPGSREETEDFPWVDLPDGRKLTRTHRTPALYMAKQYKDVELIYYVSHPDGRTERLVQAFPFRYFYPFEVEHLLARCGFRIAELYGDFDKSPLTDNSPEMIFVAEKN